MEGGIVPYDRDFAQRNIQRLGYAGAAYAVYRAIAPQVQRELIRAAWNGELVNRHQVERVMGQVSNQVSNWWNRRSEPALNREVA